MKMSTISAEDDNTLINYRSVFKFVLPVYQLRHQDFLSNMSWWQLSYITAKLIRKKLSHNGSHK